MTHPLAAPRRVWDRVPLRARLVAILLVALVVALACTGYGVQAVLRGYLVGQVDGQLNDAARMIVRSSDPFALALGVTGVAATSALRTYLLGQQDDRLRGALAQAQHESFAIVTSRACRGTRSQSRRGAARGLVTARAAGAARSRRPAGCG